MRFNARADALPGNTKNGGHPDVWLRYKTCALQEAVRGPWDPDHIHVANLERYAVPHIRHGIRNMGGRGVLVAASELSCASVWEKAPGAINEYLAPPGDLSDVQDIVVQQCSRSSLYVQNSISLSRPTQAISSKEEFSVYRRVKNTANSHGWIDRNKAGEVHWEAMFAALFSMSVAKQW